MPATTPFARSRLLSVLLAATSILVPLAAHADPASSAQPSSTADATKPDPAKVEAPKVGAVKSDADVSAASREAASTARAQQDREAFFAARLAALRAGLQLRPDQQGFWPPVETAIRALAALHRPSRLGSDNDADRPTGSSVDRLMARGERLVRRGDALKALAAATKPLLASLAPEQKERLPMLLQGLRPGWVMARAFDLPDRMGGEGGERPRRDMDRGDMDRDGMQRGDRDEGGRRYGMKDRRADDRGGLDQGDAGMDRGWRSRGDGDRDMDRPDDRRSFDRADRGDRSFDRGDEDGGMRRHHRHHHDDADGEDMLSHD